MEVLRRLKRSVRWAQVPVIIVTSSDADSDRAEAASLGANRYFLKPQDLDEYMKLGSVVKGSCECHHFNFGRVSSVQS